MKPAGFCPVQAEGFFIGYYFYFRSRWSTARIDFAKNEQEWVIHDRVISYDLLETLPLQAGYLPRWKSYLLIYWGCLRFLFSSKKKIYT